MTRLTHDSGKCAAATCMFAALLALFSSSLAAQQSVTPISVHFYGGGGTYQWLSIVVPANVTWTATTSNYNWLSFNWGNSHVNGTGPGTINLDAQQNGSGASRSATVTVTPSSGSPMTVAITQEVLIANTVPTVTVASPLSTNVPGPASQMVSVTFDDPNGPGYLPSIQFGFGFIYGYDPSCSVMYNTQYDTLYFDSPANGWQKVTLGPSGLMNSTWCQLNPATSSVVFNGTSVTLNMALTPSTGCGWHAESFWRDLGPHRSVVREPLDSDSR